MWVYKYDENFIWQAGGEIEIEIDEGEKIPNGYTDIQPPDGLYIAKYNPTSKTWSESATQEYIDSLQPDPLPLDDVTLLKKQVALLTYQISQFQKGGAS